jgi:7-carboxy-7-deazaguanine synthase
MKTIVVQNVDINARKSDYKHLASDELLMTGHPFLTIQGEGPLSGRRALFLRTAGCNFGAKDIACPWCDTSFQLAKGKVVKIREMFELAQGQFDAELNGLVVITGGEPLLQPNIISLIETLLHAHQLDIQIETNGTLLSSLSDLSRQSRFYIVCSPKQINGVYSTSPPHFNYKDSYHPVTFKFVVNADPTSSHHTLPEWSSSRIPGTRIYISPMTVYKKAYEGEVSSVWDPELVDHEATQANYQYAAKLVMANPDWCISVQMHTFLAVA